ncbi:branched-chain amino acid ABC transporter permease [Salinibacterium sp. G-O1]|uniref:branched-chain amino acid ABC transporter permease n=1 Tax=Salinibacterium sp. G-O1 TaxID=3046208 RepID=UPI0024B90B59|nr:branched-chain amino acid ABC transporter permease [Salinibacterium sp. G-O1]MDJ0334205.1 branched-chain amino acid ABC transporter permease [Salinibacterium sp. G-O1]
MTTTRIRRARWTKRSGVLALATLTATLALTLLAGPAAADDINLDKYDFKVVGNVKLNSVPLEDIEIKVDGGGYSAEVKTDAEGRWAIGVPEKGDYTVTLNEDTLPTDIAVVDEADDSPNVKEVSIGPSGSAVMNFFIGRGERNQTSFFDQLVERTVNGLNFGLMLGLAAIGLSLVYGTTSISNFAHGEMVTFGALATLVMSGGLGVPIWGAIPIAILLSMAFGYVLDAGLWRPLRKRGVGVVQLMIVSIGLSLALRYIFQFFIGGGTAQLPGADSPKIKLFGSVSLSVVDMTSMGISVVVILAVAWWLVRTRIGKATRAVADNPSLAAASGIDVDFVVRVVWIVAAGLAGLSGILWAYFRPGIRWDMGAQILLLIFAAVTLGGLGTAFGALVGSIVIGLLVELSTLWISSDLKYVGALGVLVLVLLLRPQGLLGRKERVG